MKESNQLKNNRITKTNPKGAGRKFGTGVNYVGQKFAGWTVIREVERLGIKRKTYWELQSPDDPNLKIILRVDTMKKFANKKIWSVKRHSKPLTW